MTEITSIIMNEFCHEKLDLKLCPFCGGEAEISYDYGSAIVLCPYCGMSCGNFKKDVLIQLWNRRASGWISVKERLPDLNVEVLCFNGSKRFGAYTLAEIITDSTGEAAWHIYGLHEYDAGFGSVTHWMPLPIPPENING